MRLLKKAFQRAYIKSRKLNQNEDGSAAIEFAFLGPIFIFLLLAIFEVGFVFMLDLNIEHATNEAARRVRVGAIHANSQPTSGVGGPVDVMRGTMCAIMVIVPDCENRLTIQVLTSTTYGGINVPDHRDANGDIRTDLAANFGGPQSIQMIKTTYEWNVIGRIPIIGLANRPNGAYEAQGIAVIRVE